MRVIAKHVWAGGRIKYSGSFDTGREERGEVLPEAMLPEPIGLAAW